MVSSRGFTLLELLMVITIIGLLTAIVMSALGESRVDARNAARIRLVQEYQKAIELARAEDNQYPQFGTGWVPGTLPNWACLGEYPGTACWNGNNVNEDKTATGVDVAVRRFMPSMPPGPTASGFVGFIYRPVAGGGYSIQWIAEGGAGAANYCKLANTVGAVITAGNPDTRCTLTVN